MVTQAQTITQERMMMIEKTVKNMQQQPKHNRKKLSHAKMKDLILTPVLQQKEQLTQTPTINGRCTSMELAPRKVMVQVLY